MYIQSERNGTLEGLQKAIETTSSKNGVQSLCILACDANGFSPAETDPILRRISKPVFGGIFPSIIFKNERWENGSIVIGLSETVHYKVIEGLSDVDRDFESAIDEQMTDITDLKTLMVLVDGLGTRIASFIDGLFDVFGLEFNYFGGGAGSLDLVQKPCLFTNEGLVGDAALLAPLSLKSGVGVSHGWESIEGPYKVTEAQGNVIKTLDWQPAFEVYRQVVEPHSEKVFENSNFFDIAKAYPFGIAKMGAERVVRDPLMCGDDNSLVCVGEVPEGSFVDILNSEETALIDAAGQALILAKKAYQGSEENRINFFIDCISRVLFLEDRFEEEINSVNEDNLPLVGACTIGEIANSGTDYLEFYNKTSVIAILEDR